jgi:hypothetical protein
MRFTLLNRKLAAAILAAIFANFSRLGRGSVAGQPAKANSPRPLASFTLLVGRAVLWITTEPLDLPASASRPKSNRLPRP